MSLAAANARLLMLSQQRTDTTKMQNISSDTLNKLKDKMAAEEKKGGDTSKVQSEYNKEQINLNDLNAQMAKIDAEYNAMQSQLDSLKSNIDSNVEKSYQYLG